MTLFQDSFEKAEDELSQIFRNAPEDVSPVKFAAMDLLLGCMKFPYICAVDSEIHNKNWNLSVLQDGIKKNLSVREHRRGVELSAESVWNAD